MSLHQETSAVSKIASPPRERLNVAQAPAVRWSQIDVCNALAILEAALVGVAAGIVLASIPGVTRLPPAFIGLGASFVALCVLFFSARYGAAGYEGFASRRALFPSSAVAGIVTGCACVYLGAKPGYSVFAVCALFTSVYVAKIPSIVILKALRDAGLLTRLVAIAGDEKSQREALARLLRDREDIQIVFSGSPADVSTLRDMVRENMLDEIVLAGAPCGQEQLSALAGLAVTLVRIDPKDKFERWTGRSAKWRLHVNRWNAPAAIISEPPLRNWNILAKRLIDLTCSLAILVPLLPVMAICAIAIKLESKGPVFFLQDRIGYRDKPFRIFKFRSMYADKTDHRGSQLTLRDDPRVTRVGHFLRRTSADELPQIFNVILGDMSLVGPRPHPRGVKAGQTAYDDLIPNFFARYRMKPGITGLAQINGLRGNTETEQHLLDRFESDQRYAMEWTPLLDIVILFRTLVHLTKSTNAF